MCCRGGVGEGAGVYLGRGLQDPVGRVDGDGGFYCSSRKFQLVVIYGGGSNEEEIKIKYLFVRDAFKGWGTTNIIL